MPSKRKVIIQARELSDMDVSKISLVKRGANRIPFRITKSTGDTNMLDLGTLFLKKEKKITPVVVAVALAKSVNTELYTTALATHDLTVSSVVKNDDDTTLLMLAKGELKDMGEVTAMKIDDNAAVLVTGVQKGLLTYPDTQDFNENISKAAFFPSYRMALDILTDTVGNIAYSEGDVEATKTAIQKALGDFTTYVEGALSTVPVSAFKAEEAIVATQKGMLINEGGQGEGADAEDDASGKEDKQKEDKPKEGESGEGTGEGDGTGDGEGTGDDTDTGEGAEGAGESTEGTDDAGGDAGEGTEGAGSDTGEGADVQKSNDVALSKQLEKLTNTIGDVANAVKALKGDVGTMQEGFNTQVEGLKASIKKTDEAVTGTVHSDESEDDGSVSTVTKKSEGGEANWDSALDFGEGVEQS